jgi:putative ABC transport system substrate-binding protein
MQFGQLQRRKFITLLGGATVTWPLAAHAQRPVMPVVACLIGGSKAGTERYFGGFLQGMRELGYVEGQSWSFESRYLDGNLAEVPSVAEELVRLKPDVLVSGVSAATIAFKRLTGTIPIVASSLVDPIGFGLAASHARPGGNVTGMLLTVEDLPSKQLALAVEMVPGARKIGLLVNPDNPTVAPQRSNAEAAATKLGIEFTASEARTPDDLHVAFDHLERERVAMVFALSDAMFINERKRIALLAMAGRLPTMFSFRQNVEDGALMSYGVDLRENWRRTAGFVGKILKGAKAGDLPMEFPTKLELVINLMAAKALRLSVPPTLLARADEVIE